jgi:hypothetical protein
MRTTHRLVLRSPQQHRPRIHPPNRHHLPSGPNQTPHQLRRTTRHRHCRIRSPIPIHPPNPRSRLRPPLQPMAHRSPKQRLRHLLHPHPTIRKLRRRPHHQHLHSRRRQRRRHTRPKQPRRHLENHPQQPHPRRNQHRPTSTTKTGACKCANRHAFFRGRY